MKKEPMQRYQTSMELLQDLKEALKNPDGDFVEENYDVTARTQKISLEDYENAKKCLLELLINGRCPLRGKRF